MLTRINNNNLNENITCILGSIYTNQQEEEIRSHSRSIMRLTYRSSFPQLSPYHISSDSGWGCMLRSAQMIMAQTLQRHYLGKAWRLPSPEICRQTLDYYNLVRWFTDYPGPSCIYSLHHLVQCGMFYDKLPGEWYGPSAAALVLRDLARIHRRKYRGPVEIYVTTGDTIYITEAEKTFFSQSISSSFDVDSKDEGKDNQNSHRNRQINLRENTNYSPTSSDNVLESSLKKSNNLSNENISSILKSNNLSPRSLSSPFEKYQVDLPTISLESYPHMSENKEVNQKIKASTTSNHNNNSHNNNNQSISFHDPLLNPPPNKVNEWPCGLMILVPLRLGLDRTNPVYFDELKNILQNRYCVGIIGGRPNHAIYFVGYRGDYLLGLDPHTVYSNPSLRDPFPSDEHMEQMHQSKLEELSFTQLDPSLAIGFYFRNRDEFGSFCSERKSYDEKMMKKINQEDGTKSIGYTPLFTVQYAAADLEYFGSGQSDGEEGTDLEDEYVFV